VLTRSDDARAREDRKEMLSYSRGEMIETAFPFVGFSLSDPNFNLLHDDVRLVHGMNAPASYTVQGRRNPVTVLTWSERKCRSSTGMRCRTSCHVGAGERLNEHVVGHDFPDAHVARSRTVAEKCTS
jgi:hypothetical protein